MEIIIFTHPSFTKSRSMPRYAAMLEKGMKERGHKVAVWTPQAFFYRIPFPVSGKKWLGYIDQFLIFPLQVKKLLKKRSEVTLYVFADHSLGPWIFLVKDKPHIIHCHDFLAQRSARGKFYQNKIKLTGRIYQKLIREGFRQGVNFISISEKTRVDLHDHLMSKPQISEVIYNGINENFKPGDKKEAWKEIIPHFKKTGCENISNGYILNVGGNSWYKNKRGVLEIYNSWREEFNSNLPLVMVGELNEDLTNYVNKRFWKKDIIHLKIVSDELLANLYRGASVFLFPSLAEGFGWPIAEAMACGCPVITTNEAPMTEVGGKAATYIPKRPEHPGEVHFWAQRAAVTLQDILSKNTNDLNWIVDAGYVNVRRFDSNEFIDRVENVYTRIIDNPKNSCNPTSSHQKEIRKKQDLTVDSN